MYTHVIRHPRSSPAIHFESLTARFLTYVRTEADSYFANNMSKQKLISDEVSEKIIELVRQRDNLYNPSLKDYKDADVTKHTWESIAEAFELDVSCK